jgi:ribose transport system substrate-binding protein
LTIAAAEVAMQNARDFSSQSVDLVIEFQIDEHVAPLIGHTLSSTGIPLIAVDIPHPHATYFDVDNFQVGVEGGETLAQHAIEHWKGRIDWVVGLDIAEAGSFVQSRTPKAV